MRNPPIRACALDTHAIRSSAGQAKLARHGLSIRDLRRAIIRYQAIKHIRIGTLVGHSDLGLLGATRRRWIPGRYHAVDEFLILLSWEQIDKPARLRIQRYSVGMPIRPSHIEVKASTSCAGGSATPA